MTLLDSTSLTFLADLTRDCIEASRVRPGESVDAERPANSCGCTLVRPGGRACYPAVWVQDYALTLATGFVSVGEMRDHLLLVCRTQNGAQERRLERDAVIPPYAIPDHILFDGQAIFYPGTYASGIKQGGEPWGLLPPVNNHYDFVLMAHHLWLATRDVAFLREEVAGLAVIERLRRAFLAPQADGRTGLVHTRTANRAVGFIFCDSIYMTGSLLFASLLRWRAGQQLAELEDALGERARAVAWRATVASIPDQLETTFGEPGRIGGWLMAATGVGRQPDVWGTIYALHLGLLSGAAAVAARDQLVASLDAGSIAYEGALRHVPSDHDASPTSAWERTPTPLNTYQNGAYWHTPTGWAVSVLADYAPVWSKRLFDDMIGHLRREDFRKGPLYNAPWECIGREAKAYSNPLFLGSITVPYGVLRQG